MRFQVSSIFVLLGILTQSVFGIPVSDCPRRLRLVNGTCAKNSTIPWSSISLGDPSQYLPVRATMCPKKYQLPNGSCEVRWIAPNSREIVINKETLLPPQNTIDTFESDHPLQHVAWKMKFREEIIGGKNDVGISLNLTSDGPVTYSIGYHQNDVPLKACSTVRGTGGHCRYLAHCVLDVFLHSLEELAEYAKICDDGYEDLSVCCPDPLPSTTNAPEYTTTVASIEACQGEVAGFKRSCGTEDPFQTRIFGGKIASRWPWVAALFQNQKFICGGTLISTKHVLTAAHCVLVDTSVLKIRLGEYDFTKESSSRKTYSVSRIDKPKEYRQHSYSDDIAIATLATSTDFDCNIWRICLPRNRFSYFGSEATVIGWGATSTAQKSEILLQVNIPVLTDSQCNAMVRSTTYDKDKMLCAAAEDKNSCNGDSGGPLMIKVEDQWTIFGVVSGGTDKECGTGRPAVYTRVDHYSNWIENILLYTG